MFFVPTSVAAIITTAKDKLINWKIGMSIAFVGVIGAIIGANISVNMNVNNLRKYFGIFLAMIAIYEIYFTAKKYIFEKNTHNKIKD